MGDKEGDQPEQEKKFSLAHQQHITRPGECEGGKNQLVSGSAVSNCSPEKPQPQQDHQQRFCGEAQREKSCPLPDNVEEGKEPEKVVDYLQALYLAKANLRLIGG